MMRTWFIQQFHRRAKRGGEEWFGRLFKGGEFLPFYVPRPVMPQINEEDYEDFIEFAAERGVEVTVRFFAPEALKPHQRLDKFKAAHMSPEVGRKTVFASLDNFILDGNHRWMYHRITRTRVPTYQVRLPFNDAIALMFDFPKTYALENHDEQN